MLRAGLLLASSLVVGLSASGQQSGRPSLDSAYHGIWAVNGSCDDVTFIFAASWIERAGEDICYIDTVTPHAKGVRVVATCWHEFRSFGQSTFDMARNADGTMTFGTWPDERIKRCGPVPQELVKAYKDRR